MNDDYKKVLLTGGLGFIGSHTAVALAEAGFCPVIVDNLSNSHLQILDGIGKIIGPKVSFYEINVCDQEGLATVFKKEKPLAVIHFAASKQVGESMEQPLTYYHNNLLSLIILLETMKQQNVSNFIFSSSAAVYSPEAASPISEQGILGPISPYGRTKRMAEEIIADVMRADKNLRSIALRYFNPVGAHPSAFIGEWPKVQGGNLAPTLFNALARGATFTVNGNDYDTPDGTCIRDFVHIVDLAEAHAAALGFLLAQQSHYADVFNVGTGKGTTILQFIKTFEEVSGKVAPYAVGPRRAGDMPVVYADSGKIEKIMRWKSRLTLADALRDGWRWAGKITT